MSECLRKEAVEYILSLETTRPDFPSHAATTYVKYLSPNGLIPLMSPPPLSFLQESTFLGLECQVESSQCKERIIKKHFAFLPL